MHRSMSNLEQAKNMSSSMQTSTRLQLRKHCYVLLVLLGPATSILVMLKSIETLPFKSAMRSLYLCSIKQAETYIIGKVWSHMTISTA